MRKYSIFILSAMLVLLSSCGTYKRLGYLQDMEEGITYSMPIQPDAHIAKGDKLSIVVACSTPALAVPFNILSGVSPIDPVASTGGNSGSSGSESTKGPEVSEGYEVDKNGDMDFPVLGRMHVEGMTLAELKEKIETQIIQRRYIKDPVVAIRFTNFRFTIIGEGGTGVYSSTDGKVNIFDALAMSGDLSEDAVRNDVWIVRTVDGKRRLWTIDLKTKDCYYSPAFFIQQNDMIYVKPKDSKFDTAVSNRWTVINSVIGVFGTALNAMIWMGYFAK